ncbi:MAG: phospholipase D family protein [Bdellovibrionota bacterium]
MSIKLFFAAVVFNFLFSNNSFAFFADSNTFKNTKYDVCFTPGGNCTDLVVDVVGSAKKEVLVQAYSFTSAPIAKAIVDAQKRGVKVRVILDKSQFSEKYSAAKFLEHEQVPVWNDRAVAIAHNKVMIIDDSIVITGSFNFTKAAQMRNAENLLIVYDKDFAAKYKNNWYNRMKSAEKIN